MITKRKNLKPSLKQPLSGGVGTKPTTRPLNRKHLLDAPELRRVRKKPAK